jgi:hypothetical protein
VRVKSVKRARIANEPVLQKKALFSEPQIDGHPLAWRFSGCDRGGPFAWVINSDLKYGVVSQFEFSQR